MRTSTLFSPRHPVLGMVSSRSIFTLKPGEYSLLQNVRVDDGIITARDGLGDLTATGLPNGWCVGAAQLVLNGTDYVFIAVDTGTSIRVLASTGVAFTEWTGTGGSGWSETRFVSGVTPASYKSVAIVAVKAATRADSGILSSTADEDIVIASDGVKAIASSVSDATFRPMTRAATPTKLNQFRQEATFPDFMPISSGLSGTDRSDADVTVSTGATCTATGGTAPQIKFEIGCDKGLDYGELQWTTANNICQGPVVVVAYSCSDTALWDKVKLSFFDSTAAALKVVWDPTSTTTTKDKPTVLTIDASKNLYMAVFVVDEANTPAADNYSRFRLTYVADPDPSTAAIDFYLMGWYSGGVVPGGTLFQVSSYGSLTYSESEAVTCQDLGGVQCTQLGNTDKRNVFSVPVTSACSYAYRVSYPCNSQVVDGIDYTLVYAQFPVENGYRPEAYYLVAQDNFGTAGSGYSAGYSAGGLQTVVVNSATLLPKQAPKPFHKPVMPFKSACWADGRLWLGGVKKDDSATLFGGVFVSAKGDPFDFSEFERFHRDGSLDLSGPATVPLGSETPQAIVSIASRAEQDVTAPLAVVTDKSTWAFNTADTSTIIRPIIVATYGTKSPASVVVGGRSLYFFDTFRQIRVVSQGVDSPSQWVVDSLWRGIPTSVVRTGANPQSRPRVERVCCAYYRDKLYVFYTQTGAQYNTACSVYDTVNGLWYDDALASGNVERAFVWPVVGDEPQLRCFSVGDDTSAFGAPPKLYQHEKSGQTTDDGSAISVNIVTGYLSHPSSDEPMALWALHQVGMVCDEVTSGSFTVSRTVLPSGDTSTSTSIDLDDDNSGAYIWRWDTDSSGNKAVLASGFAHKFSLTSTTFTPGKTIMAIYYKWDDRQAGTDTNG